MKFNIKGLGMSFAGGALGGIAAEKFEDYMREQGKEVNEKTTPLLIGGLAAAIHYFGKGKMDALAFGMMGSAGSDLGLQMFNKIGSGSDGATNGTPSQLSPETMNGLRERVQEARRKMGGGSKGAGTRTAHKSSTMRRESGGGDDFYTNPYSNQRVA